MFHKENSQPNTRPIIYILFLLLILILVLVLLISQQITGVEDSNVADLNAIEADEEFLLSDEEAESLAEVNNVIANLQVPPESIVYIDNCNLSNTSINVAPEQLLYFVNGADVVDLTFSHEPEFSYQLQNAGVQTFQIPVADEDIVVTCNGEPVLRLVY